MLLHLNSPLFSLWELYIFFMSPYNLSLLPGSLFSTSLHIWAECIGLSLNILPLDNLPITSFHLYHKLVWFWNLSLQIRSVSWLTLHIPFVFQTSTSVFDRNIRLHIPRLRNRTVQGKTLCIQYCLYQQIHEISENNWPCQSWLFPIIANWLWSV